MCFICISFSYYRSSMRQKLLLLPFSRWGTEFKYLVRQPVRVYTSGTINEWPSSTSVIRHSICHNEDSFCNNYLDINMGNFGSKAHDPESKYVLKSLCYDIKANLQSVRMQKGNSLEFKEMGAGAWILALAPATVCQLCDSGQNQPPLWVWFPALYDSDNNTCVVRLSGGIKWADYIWST